MKIRVVLPYHLKRLAKVGAEVDIEVEDPLTQRRLLDALELKYPVLRGTIRDHASGARRPLLRFFACSEDVSHEPPDTFLPTEVVQGHEPFMIVGAVSGG